MKRRTFLGMIGGAAVWQPLALAQQATAPRRVGVLMARLENDPEAQRQIAALRKGLRDLNWKIGESVVLEARWVVGDPKRALELARELVDLKPDVLIANATPSLIALRQTTSTIRSPIPSVRASYRACPILAETSRGSVRKKPVSAESGWTI